jgi:IS30 family transposase
LGTESQRWLVIVRWRKRDLLAQLLHQGHLPKDIAAALWRLPGTISRELKRNHTGLRYHAGQAQEKARQRRRDRKLTRKMDRPEIREFVAQGLANCWSPDQISGRAAYEFPDQPQRQIGRQTIYNWIQQQPPKERAQWKESLRRRGKRPRRKPQNAADSAEHAALAQRPAVIHQRRRIGDFEGDTVLGLGQDLIDPAVDQTRLQAKLVGQITPRFFAHEMPTDDLGLLFWGEMPACPGHENLRSG